MVFKCHNVINYINANNARTYYILCLLVIDTFIYFDFKVYVLAGLGVLSPCHLYNLK